MFKNPTLFFTHSFSQKVLANPLLARLQCKGPWVYLGHPRGWSNTFQKDKIGELSRDYHQSQSSLWRKMLVVQPQILPQHMLITGWSPMMTQRFDYMKYEFTQEEHRADRRSITYLGGLVGHAKEMTDEKLGRCAAESGNLTLVYPSSVGYIEGQDAEKWCGWDIRALSTRCTDLVGLGGELVGTCPIILGGDEMLGTNLGEHASAK